MLKSPLAVRSSIFILAPQSDTIDSTNIKDDTFINYFLKGSLDKFDSPTFPHSGWTMNGIEDGN